MIIIVSDQEFNFFLLANSLHDKCSWGVMAFRAREFIRDETHLIGVNITCSHVDYDVFGFFGFF